MRISSMSPNNNPRFGQIYVKCEQNNNPEALKQAIFIQEIANGVLTTPYSRQGCIEIHDGKGEITQKYPEIQLGNHGILVIRPNITSEMSPKDCLTDKQYNCDEIATELDSKTISKAMEKNFLLGYFNKYKLYNNISANQQNADDKVKEALNNRDTDMRLQDYIDNSGIIYKEINNDSTSSLDNYKYTLACLMGLKSKDALIEIIKANPKLYKLNVSRDSNTNNNYVDLLLGQDEDYMQLIHCELNDENIEKIADSITAKENLAKLQNDFNDTKLSH